MVAFALTGTVAVQPAPAQNFFEAIFGGIDRAIRRDMPPRVMAYGDPRNSYDDRRERRYLSDQHASPRHEGAGPSSGYCVRTCDGKYFHVRSSGNMSATELCKSFCPAAQTKVFGGSKIDYSVASDGTRYAALPNAFLFRERVVAGCTCNGKTAGGLVPLDPETDPTLRPGDIVATNDGLATYTGGRNNKSAEFTPVASMSGSNEWQRRLMSIKVTPAPQRTNDAAEPAVTPEPAVENKARDKTAERLDLRRAQR